MAKLTDEERESIIRRDLPGYKSVGEPAGGFSKSLDSDSSRLPGEASTPDLAALRRKYFGDEAESDEGDARPATRGAAAAPEDEGTAKDFSSPDDNDDDEIVAVEPEFKRDAWDRGSRPKSVVISNSKKKIIGSQG